MRFVVVAVRGLVIEQRGLEEVPSVSRPGVLTLPRQRSKQQLLLRVRVAEKRGLSIAIAERHRGSGGVLQSCRPYHPPDVSADARPSSFLAQSGPGCLLFVYVPVACGCAGGRAGERRVSPVKR